MAKKYQEKEADKIYKIFSTKLQIKYINMINKESYLSRKPIMLLIEQLLAKYFDNEKVEQLNEVEIPDHIMKSKHRKRF